jgi:hypothetical protein
MGLCPVGYGELVLKAAQARPHASHDAVAIAAFEARMGPVPYQNVILLLEAVWRLSIDLCAPKESGTVRSPGLCH